jgi:hypothetical protein
LLGLNGTGKTTLLRILCGELDVDCGTVERAGALRIVWTATFANYLLLLMVLFVRRRAASFPAFTTYVAFAIIDSIAQFLALYYLAFATYRNIYYSLEILDQGLLILVFYELAVHVFCPTGAWARDVRRAFLSLVAASAGVAFLLAWIAQPPAPLRVQTFILRADFFSSLLMCELFVGTVVLAVTVGLPWKTHVARIAQGLGAYSLFSLAIGIGVASVGITADNAVFAALMRAQKLVWLACQVYWIVTLWREAPAPRELPEVMRAQILTLQNRVKDDLMRIRGRRNR